MESKTNINMFACAHKSFNFLFCKNNGSLRVKNKCTYVKNRYKKANRAAVACRPNRFYEYSRLVIKLMVISRCSSRSTVAVLGSTTSLPESSYKVNNGILQSFSPNFHKAVAMFQNYLQTSLSSNKHTICSFSAQ